MDEEENDYVEAHGFDDDDGEAEEEEEDGNEGRCNTYFFIISCTHFSHNCFRLEDYL